MTVLIGQFRLLASSLFSPTTSNSPGNTKAMSEILNLIHQITANGDSGRLEILAGAVQGELSFADGKLVDARVGHLTGFRAVNAAVAMRDARFSFDPLFAPLASSSITASERVVLKQFFGIETAPAIEYFEPAPVTWPAEAAPVVPVPETADEVTLVSSNVLSAEVPATLPHPSGFMYRRAVAFAALAIAVLTTAAVLMYKFSRPSSPAVVARIEPTSSSATSTIASSAPAPAAVKAAPVKEDQKPRTTAARDLSGKWNVVNTVETTSYGTYKNMKIGFALSINQTGKTFSGSGRKVSENGRSLPAGSRTPIQVQGSIEGDRIEATFFEDGTARKSNGRFIWRIDKAGRGLSGNFATTAARSSGRSSATREM